MNRFMMFSTVLFSATAFCLAAVPRDKAEQQPKERPTLQVVEARLGTEVQNKALVGDTAEFAVNRKVYLWLKITGGRQRMSTSSGSVETGFLTPSLRSGVRPGGRGHTRLLPSPDRGASQFQMTQAIF